MRELSGAAARQYAKGAGARPGRRLIATLVPPLPNPLPRGERGYVALLVGRMLFDRGADWAPSPLVGEGWGEGARSD